MLIVRKASLISLSTDHSKGFRDRLFSLLWGRGRAEAGGGGRDMSEGEGNDGSRIFLGIRSCRVCGSE